MMRRMMDLHCDTLTKGEDLFHSLDNPALMAALSKLPRGTEWAQFFAVFIPDEFRGEAAAEYFDRYYGSFTHQMELYANRIAPCRSGAEIRAAFASGRHAAILTVEGGCVLKGELRRIALLRERGVRALTLVWNGENELGSGVSGEGGLTEFGKACISELEKNGIFIDVSHLNDAGFEDVAERAERPFIATHSNARAIADHPRNLTDRQIRIIAERGGLIGLNYYVRFLRDDGAPCTMEDLLRHAEHILALGGEDVLALGSDYDGADLPECLDSVEKAFAIGDYLLSKNYSEALVERIMFRNAMNFFDQNLQ